MYATNTEKRRVKAINKHYRKLSVRKDFGMHGSFSGHITDCWVAHSGQEYAHVLYVDGDEEDIPLQEVRNFLMAPLPPTPPTSPRSSSAPSSESSGREEKECEALKELAIGARSSITLCRVGYGRTEGIEAETITTTASSAPASCAIPPSGEMFCQENASPDVDEAKEASTELLEEDGACEAEGGIEKRKDHEMKEAGKEKEQALCDREREKACQSPVRRHQSEGDKENRGTLQGDGGGVNSQHSQILPAQPQKSAEMTVAAGSTSMVALLEGAVIAEVTTLGGNAAASATETATDEPSSHPFTASSVSSLAPSLPACASKDHGGDCSTGKHGHHTDSTRTSTANALHPRPFNFSDPLPRSPPSALPSSTASVPLPANEMVGTGNSIGAARPGKELTDYKPLVGRFVQKAVEGGGKVTGKHRKTGE
ncbi:hypothetical protein Naga_100282g2 [Nannochloropsis gaditana]|uniref:Tudor domain-containing protein n=2 Tax=Nannochloropsis gaditana TaxID=72520 RepID=W7U508_9STRA|nr:hypothetical protein Naga_100282g2 [Nannochloropsis gaditana]